VCRRIKNQAIVQRAPLANTQRDDDANRQNELKVKQRIRQTIESKK
jgi:hypothetical protein